MVLFLVRRIGSGGSGKGETSVSKRATVACKGFFSRMRMCPPVDKGCSGLRVYDLAHGWWILGRPLGTWYGGSPNGWASVCGAQVSFWRLMNHAQRRLSPRLPARGNGCDRSVLSRCSRCSIHCLSDSTKVFVRFPGRGDAGSKG